MSEHAYWPPGSALANGYIAPFESDLAYGDAAVAAAFYDPLTGLVSRPLCLNRLAHALADGTRYKPGIAVLAVSPDGLASEDGLNDLLVLALSRRLLASVRAADTASHFGRGLFIVLVADINSVLDANRVAQRLIDELRVVMEIEGRRVPVSVGVGVAFSRFCGGEAEANQLVQEACQALAGAQAVRPGNLHVIAPHQHDESDETALDE